MKKGYVGIGLDQDGHVRITKTENGGRLIGGTQETHERMQEAAIRFEEGLKKDGKTINDISADEFHDRVAKAQEKS